MALLKVIILGTSPAETLRLEEALHQTGCLGTSRYIGLEPAQNRIPVWTEWDLIIARYQERTGTAELSLLASVLRQGSPPVIFLVDPFDPLLVNRLQNAGGIRVLPVEQVEELLEVTLQNIFQVQKMAECVPAARSDNGRQASAAQNGPILPEVIPSLPKYVLTNLFYASPVGISINRLRDGRCLDCNESLANLLESPREDLVGQNLLELAIPEEVRARFEAVIAGQSAPEPMQFERRIYTGKRNIRSVLIRTNLVLWENEPCLFFFVQDTSEMEQAQEKVRNLNNEMERMVQVRTSALEAANHELASEIGLRKELESLSNKLGQITWETPDVVAVYAEDGQVEFLNKAGRELFGLEADISTSGLDAFSVYPEATRRRVMEEVLPELQRNGIWRGETEFILPDGRIIPLSQVLLCKKDETGKVLYYATVARDVSDFKKVEQDLRHSEERYRTLAEAAHDLIFMVSKDGIMQYANGYACRALGFDPEKVVGLHASQFFPKDFSTNHLQMFYDVHEIDQPVYTEGPFTRENGQMWLGTWLVPVHGSNGELTSILGISRDISEQKKTDEALQRALQNERKLGEMRSNFFSMTSHQFRTPLSTILLSAELLQKYGQRWDDQKRGEHLGRIQEAAHRLNSMLEDILVIGRVESGRYVIAPKDFDLIEYCDRSIQEMQLNDRSEHTFHFHHDLNNLPVLMDQEVLHRVLDNLLSNALKYSPKGSSVTVSVKKEERYILLEVADEGIGIPERDMQYLFQPFQRGSNASDYPGTGIGLTIIQKSVELMKGTISLKSKEGQGTTFMVRFPARIDNTYDRGLA